MSSLQQAKNTKTRTFTAILHWEEDVYVTQVAGYLSSSASDSEIDAIASKGRLYLMRSRMAISAVAQSATVSHT